MSMTMTMTMNMTLTVEKPYFDPRLVFVAPKPWSKYTPYDYDYDYDYGYDYVFDYNNAFADTLQAPLKLNLKF